MEQDLRVIVNSDCLLLGFCLKAVLRHVSINSIGASASSDAIKLSLCHSAVAQDSTFSFSFGVAADLAMSWN